MNDWNSFRRIEAAFNKEIPDKVPKYEGTIEIPDLNPIIRGQEDHGTVFLFTPQHIDLFHKNPSIFLGIKKSIEKGKTKGIKRIIPSPESISKIHRDYNYDMFGYVAGIPMVLKDQFFNDFYGDEDGKVIRGPGGRLVFRISPDGAHTRHGFFRTPEDWEKYIDLNGEHPGNFFLVEDTVKSCKDLDIVPIFSVFGCGFFEELCGIFGFEALFKLLVKDKTFIESVVKELSDFSLILAEKIIENGGQYIYMTCDLGYKGRSIISPRMFQKFFKPGITKFCNKVHELGGYVMMHSCGYVMELLPDIIETGVDALHPIEKAAGNDIVEIKQKYGKKFTIVGNVPIPLLSHGTPEENYNYVIYLLENVSKDGGHIISTSHSVTQWCKLENFKAYHKAIEDYGKYPINTEEN